MGKHPFSSFKRGTVTPTPRTPLWTSPHHPVPDTMRPRLGTLVSGSSYFADFESYRSEWWTHHHSQPAARSGVSGTNVPHRDTSSLTPVTIPVLYLTLTLRVPAPSPQSPVPKNKCHKKIITFRNPLDKKDKLYIIFDCCPRNGANPRGGERQRTLTIEKQQK